MEITRHLPQNDNALSLNGGKSRWRVVSLTEKGINSELVRFQFVPGIGFAAPERLWVRKARLPQMTIARTRENSRTFDKEPPSSKR